MRAILLIDHGSVSATRRITCCRASPTSSSRWSATASSCATLTWSSPSRRSPQGFAECVRAGATEVIAFPYMLSPGKHVTRDVPRLVAEAAREFPHVTFRVTDAFGVHEKLAELIALRAGVDVVAPLVGGRRVPLLGAGRPGRRVRQAALRAPRHRRAPSALLAT